MKRYTLKQYIKKELNVGNKYTFRQIFLKLIFNHSLKSVFIIRLAQHFKQKKIPFIPGYLSRKLIRRYGCFISQNADIEMGLKFPHPNGVIIGDLVKIGKSCTIYQQVTLGGKITGDAQNGNYPKIGSNVTIFAGAKIIGNIKIGDNSIIGANSVVNKNIPSNSIAAGVPAKILRTITNIKHSTTSQ